MSKNFSKTFQPTEIKNEWKGKNGKMSKKKGERSYQRNDVRDKKLEKIKDYIKERQGKNDDRDFLNGIFWILRTESSWMDLPSDYGKCHTVHKKFLI